MNRLLASFVFLLPPVLIAQSSPPPAPSNELRTPEQLAGWQDLFARLSEPKTRLAQFEERRFFPFKKTPAVLTGEIRLAPDHGLSLHYLTPKTQVMIVDSRGVLMRNAKGQERAAPSDPRAQAATAALYAVLAFDLPALQRDFTLHGVRDGELWTLGFEPRDAAVRDLIGSIIVSGEAGQVNQINLVKSESQRIEIALREAAAGVTFSDADMETYFR